MSETRTLTTGEVIQKTRIIGMNLDVYSAWEPTEDHAHSTITTFEDYGPWYGRVATRRLTPELDALPAMSRERSEAVGRWHEAQYEEAYALILAAFPEAANGRRSSGHIDCTNAQ